MPLARLNKDVRHRLWAMQMMKQHAHAYAHYCSSANLEVRAKKIRYMSLEHRTKYIR